MTNRSNHWTWTIPVLATALVVWYYVGSVQKRTYADHEKKRQGYVWVDCRPFPVPGGWGYDIMVDNKGYIHQSFVPGVPGHRAFASKDDALKVGNFIIQKLKKGVIPPSISSFEMDSLGITRN
jgi:hypothetical protein